MEKDIWLLRQFLQEGRCCAQALVAMGMKIQGTEDHLLEDSAAALCQGLHAGMLCGAVSGGAVCLSIFDRELAVSDLIPRLSEWFRESCMEMYGGTDCSTILAGDPANRAVRCPLLVENVWRKIRELLEDEGFDLDAMMEMQG